MYDLLMIGRTQIRRIVDGGGKQSLIVKGENDVANQTNFMYPVLSGE